MSFNLEQLSKAEISAQELDQATQVLEQDLVEMRRNLAYAIANLQCLEVQKTQDPKNRSQSSSELKQKHVRLTTSVKEIGFSQTKIAEIKQTL